ncbi:MAG: tetratricopeptide repeat protein [Acidobacteriia bacterium]|nr:tetratricopeptide repeat protein [Terriglobia bacterium]
MALLLVVPANTLEARTRKGDKLVKLARDAEALKQYDKALDYYEQALSQDPQDPGYQLGSRRLRFQASQEHVDAGVKLRKDGKLDQALAEFQRAFSIDPGSAVALQEIQQTKEALDQVTKGAVRPGETPLTSVEKARKESLAMIESLLPVPELKPITNLIPQLKMNNQPLRVLYETVGKLAGVNVLFDPQMQPGRNSNLDLNNVTLDQALDYIALLTKTFWKPISTNAIFVTEDNVTKRRDYEDEVVKVFYLKNPTSVQEFQELVTQVRSVSDVRRMFPFNAQNAVIVRDTTDKVALVEKLLHDLDKPKAEVVVDLIVMEANSERTRNLAATLVSGTTNGLVVPFGFTPRNAITQPATGGGTDASGNPSTGSSSTSAVSLAQLGHISSADFSTTLPGALLQAVMTDNNTRVMQSPEVRVSDGQKVDLKIGDRVPYATGSFQPGIGTVGVSPLVSTQFQFVDTGVNLTITPHVHGNDEVTLHVSVDISNVSRTVNLGGLDQPVISQRKNEADIRLRDGEVSLLGGLMQSQDTLTISGIPGLTNIPVLGKYLFGSTNKDRSRGELLIALIPHIVRRPDITGLDLRGVAAGTDANVKLNYGPRPDESAPAAAPAPASPAAPAAPAAPAPSAPAGSARLSFVPPGAQAQLSGPVVVTLQADGVSDLWAAPIKVKWDPKILRLNQVTPGSLLVQSGGVNPPSLDIRNDAGEASIDVSRVAGAAGVNGSGALMQFTFTAVGQGTTNLSVTAVNLRDSKQQAIAVSAPSVSVTVQ